MEEKKLKAEVAPIKPKELIWAKDRASLQLVEVKDENPNNPPRVPGYTLQEPIARGASGTVFRGKNLLDGKSEAIKIFRKDLISNPDAENRFEREVKTLSKLRHPNIVKILGYGKTEDSSPFMVMEMVEGVTIRTILETEGVFEPHRAAEIARQICRALDAVHAKSFIHRDLKPSNIIVDSENVVRLVDFGIAKAAGSCTDTLTQYGSIIGTPAYMSPEQCQGEIVDQRSDIYALGCTLFEMLTGIKAFESKSPVEAITKQISTDRSHIKVQLKATGAPASLQSIVIKCLERDPARRYRTAVELDHDLSAYLLNIPLKFASDLSKRLAVGAGCLSLFMALSLGFVFLRNMPSQVKALPTQSSLPAARPVDRNWAESRIYYRTGTAKRFGHTTTVTPGPIAIYNRIGGALMFSDPKAVDMKQALQDASTLGIPLERADLRGADLEGANLSGLDLTLADLTGANLTKATLSKVNLEGADLSNADLTAAKLNSVNLRNARLKSAYLSECQAVGVNLRGANLTSASLAMANLHSALCRGATFRNAGLWQTNFSEAECAGANFSEAELVDTNFENANLSAASFSDARLTAVEVPGADLHGTGTEAFNHSGTLLSNQ